MIFGAGSVVRAATLTVGNLSSTPCTGTYSTISAAVAAASAGDTIKVCPGTYPESVGVDKGLIINGANAGISPNAGSRLTESVVTGASPTIRLNTTDSVTIDGFTFSGTTGAIIDSYMTGNKPTIERNIFTAAADSFFFANSDIVTFEDNYLHDLTDCDVCEGLFLAGNWNGATGTVASIKSNVWSTVGGPGMNLSNVKGTLSGNRFSFVTYYGSLLANGTNLDVSGNTFDHTINPNPTVRTWGAGVRFFTPSAGFGARITGNTFTSNYVGIGVRQGTSDPTVDITGMDVYAHQNNFVGNTAAGLRHDGLGTFNATCNWWNSPSGPTNVGNPGGTGDVVDGTGPVTFKPWLVAPGPSGSCLGGLPPKDCKKALEQKEADFEARQRAADKAFDDQQKAAKKAFEATHPTAAQKRAFDDQQRAARKAFDGQQEAAEKAFNKQNEIDEKQCESGKDDKDDKKDKGEKHDH
jgi:hypothetical protein